MEHDHPLCCSPGCPGGLLLMPISTAVPDLWVRRESGDGAWSCTNLGPALPQERMGPSYRCPTCEHTFTVVEG